MNFVRRLAASVVVLVMLSGAIGDALAARGGSRAGWSSPRPVPAGSYSATRRSVPSQATQLQSRMGRNSITLRSPGGQTRYDVAGATHFNKQTGRNVDTPHVTQRQYNVNPRTGASYLSGETQPRPMTQQDARTVRRYLDRIR